MSTQNTPSQTPTLSQEGEDESEAMRRLNEYYANISRRHQQPSMTIRPSFESQQNSSNQTNNNTPTSTTTTTTTTSTTTNPNTPSTPNNNNNNNNNSWRSTLGSFFSFSRENLTNVARNLSQSLSLSSPSTSSTSTNNNSNNNNNNNNNNSSDSEEGWVVMRDGRSINQEIYDEATARVLQSIYREDSSMEVSEDEIKDFVEHEVREIERENSQRPPPPQQRDYLYPRNNAVNTNNAPNANNTFPFPTRPSIPVQMPTDPFQSALLQLLAPAPLGLTRQNSQPIVIRFGSNSQQNPDILSLMQLLMRNEEMMRSQLQGVDFSQLEEEAPDLSYEQLSSLENVNRGASNAENLPTSIYHTNEPRPSASNSCAICLSEYQEGDELKTLPCFHIYHKDCIDEWLKNSKQCAICKIDVE